MDHVTGYNVVNCTFSRATFCEKALFKMTPDRTCDYHEGILTDTIVDTGVGGSVRFHCRCLTEPEADGASHANECVMVM